MAENPNAYVVLIREVVEALERSSSEQRNLTQAQVALTAEIRMVTTATAAVITLWSAEQSAAKASKSSRNKAVTALWQSHPVQLLLWGIVMAILQGIGVAWFAHAVLSQSPPPIVLPQHEVFKP